MKKRSILMSICALVTAFSIGFATGCGGADHSAGNDSTVSTGGSGGDSTSSDSTPDDSTPGDSTPDDSTPSDTPDDPTPDENALFVTAPVGEVYPYIDTVKNYLQAGEGAKVGDYHKPVSTQGAPIQIKWKYSAEGARKFIVEYATKADFSDALSVEAGAAKRSVEVKNLYKGTKYYVRVSALDKSGQVKHTAESTFETTDLGPRFMLVDDVHNMRDLGGYQTASGKTLAQGIAYRSGALTPPTNSSSYYNELSEEGKAYMSDVLGIKTEIDFRSERESGVLLENGSLIPGATLKYVTLNGYGDTFQYDDEYRDFFSTLANPDSYPVLMHCTGGADRTGTVVYLLHTMLGVSELECLQGYELTSFSTYGLRDTQDGGTYQTYFQGFMQKLNTYAGSTLQEKAETWMRGIGVTQAQIDSIKAIFYGEVEIGGGVSDDDTPDDVTPTPAAIEVTAPEGEVFPYADEVKAYLQAGAGADVANYWVSMENAYAPVVVRWNYTAEAAAKFVVEYATKEDFSDALSVTAGTTARSAELYNLYRGTTYYVRVSAYNRDGEMLYISDISDFQTTSLGPRVMKVDDIHNVRDLGGYETSFGKTIVQGIAYRGGSLTPPPKDSHYDSNLSEEGKKYMSEFLGIKGELDFRNEEESGVLLADGSVIPGATLTYHAVVAYASAISGGQERYRKVFSYLSDENNYPLYYHCTGGADRTGTVTFLLHALLGVSELECIQGYEMTSFSTYGVRSSQSGRWGEEFQPFLEGLKAFHGNNLQEKTENYLLSIGVTEDEIYNIKAIFFGEPTKISISAPTTYSVNVDDDFVINISGKKVPAKLYLGGQEVPFTYNAGKMTVAAVQLPTLPSGTTEGRVVFVDGVEMPFSLEWKVLNVMKMDGLFTFGENGTITLTDNKVALSSTGVIGYENTALIRAQTTTVENTNGGYRIFLGSYGFECRGGEVRPYTLDANGTMKEVARDAGMGLSNTRLDSGATVYLSVAFIEDKPVMTVRVERGADIVEYTYTFAARVANEIASENAKMTFWIRTDAVTSFTIYNSSAWANR